MAGKSVVGAEILSEKQEAKKEALCCAHKVGVFGELILAATMLQGRKNAHSSAANLVGFKNLRGFKQKDSSAHCGQIRPADGHI